MTDLRSLAKRWNDVSLRPIANLREPWTSSRWPLIGMFAAGLVAGTIGSYAVTQRSQIRRLATRAVNGTRQVRLEFGEVEVPKSDSATPHHSNHRRKAVVEVT